MDENNLVNLQVTGWLFIVIGFLLLPIIFGLIISPFTNYGFTIFLILLSSIGIGSGILITTWFIGVRQFFQEVKHET